MEDLNRNLFPGVTSKTMPKFDPMIRGPRLFLTRVPKCMTGLLASESAHKSNRIYLPMPPHTMYTEARRAFNNWQSRTHLK